MGIQDRDYMRERERPDRRPSGRRTLFFWRRADRPVLLAIIVLVLAAIVGAGLWMSHKAALPAAAPVVAVENTSPPADDVGGDSQVTSQTDASDNPVLVGTVTRVLDGDTIEVQLDSGPIRVRLGSIDAPEKNQPFGKQSSAALARKLGHAEVALEVVTQDQYERLVAVVYLGDENVNEWMVEQGNAWAYRQYLEDPQYCSWEFAARSGGRGLWALPEGDTNAPWEWRAVQRHRADGFRDYSRETVQDCVDDMHGAKQRAKPVVAVSQSNSSSNGNCRIKGNISSSGKIYHVPGSNNYDRTRIDTSKGERWFCSEQQAIDAGWRAPRG